MLLKGRVKCDETVPHCRKCLDTGRKCEGPVTRQIRFIGESLETWRPPVPVVVLPEISLLSPQHNADERWAFHYFLHRAAPLFAGVVDGPFWLELVPRLAHTYEFVWNGVISCGWMFEHAQHHDRDAAYDPAHPQVVSGAAHRKALKWYQRSVAGFRHLLEQGDADDGQTLVSCVLFASFEFQQ